MLGGEKICGKRYDGEKKDEGVKVRRSGRNGKDGEKGDDLEIGKKGGSKE